METKHASKNNKSKRFHADSNRWQEAIEVGCRYQRGSNADKCNTKSTDAFGSFSPNGQHEVFITLTHKVRKLASCMGNRFIQVLKLDLASIACFNFKFSFKFSNELLITEEDASLNKMEGEENVLASIN